MMVSALMQTSSPIVIKSNSENSALSVKTLLPAFVPRVCHDTAFECANGKTNHAIKNANEVQLNW